VNAYLKTVAIIVSIIIGYILIRVPFLNYMLSWMIGFRIDIMAYIYFIIFHIVFMMGTYLLIYTLVRIIKKEENIFHKKIYYQVPFVLLLMIALLGRGQAYDFFPIQLNPSDLLISDVTYNYKFAIILFNFGSMFMLKVLFQNLSNKLFFIFIFAVEITQCLTKSGTFDVTDLMFYSAGFFTAKYFIERHRKSQT